MPAMIPTVPADPAACWLLLKLLPAMGPPMAPTSASRSTLMATATSHPKKAAPQLKPPNLWRAPGSASYAWPCVWVSLAVMCVAPVVERVGGA